MHVPSTAEAVAASVECGRRLGLPAGTPRVIAEGYSVRVHLHPTPVVTRVVTAGRILRGDPLPWMRREVEVAAYLTSRGVAVVAPWPEAGPHVVDGLEVSLWTLVEQLPGEIAAVDFGPMLFELHRALERYEAPLPTLVGPLTDIGAGLAASNDPMLHEAAARLLPLVDGWPARPLHGDAHTGNVVLTVDGPRWIDLEDVCVGPVEWDLASRTLSDASVRSYPGAVDPVRLRQCRDLRALQVLACLLTDDVQPAELYDELVAGLRP